MSIKIEQEIITIKISDLHLWSENPRDPMDAEADDLTIIKQAIKDEREKWNLSGFLKEMGHYYDKSELPIVVLENEKYMIYDGNRRVAVIKYLQNPEWHREIEGTLFPPSSKHFEEMDEIECNVCNRETALSSIWRKHEKNSSWGQIEREYFKHNLLGEDKSLFLKFEKATNIISDNPCMNQEIVKSNILTGSQLEEMGFSFDDDDNLVSSYDNDMSKKILDRIVNLKKDKSIQSRGETQYRIKPHFDRDPEFKGKIKSFDATKSNLVEYTGGESAKTTPRKTKVQKKCLTQI